MKITNRSNGVVSYSLPELNIRREFQINEHKDVTAEELECLWQLAGGDYLVKELLLVEDKDWVMAHWDAPIEYFWTSEEIKNCVLHDDLDLFSETLDYAPEGVMEIIKYFAWSLPMKDLNKVEILEQKTGFNAQLAATLMKPKDETAVETSTKKERLRRKEL